MEIGRRKIKTKEGRREEERNELVSMEEEEEKLNRKVGQEKGVKGMRMK